jgi:hypothetical protein
MLDPRSPLPPPSALLLSEALEELVVSKRQVRGHTTWAFRWQ